MKCRITRSPTGTEPEIQVSLSLDEAQSFIAGPKSPNEEILLASLAKALTDWGILQNEFWDAMKDSTQGG